MTPSAFNKQSVHPGLDQPVNFHTSSMPALRTPPPTPYQQDMAWFLAQDATSDAEKAQMGRAWMGKIKARYAAMTGIESGVITLTRQEWGRHLFMATINLNHIDKGSFIGRCEIMGNMLTDHFSEMNLIDAEAKKL